MCPLSLLIHSCLLQFLPLSPRWHRRTSFIRAQVLTPAAGDEIKQDYYHIAVSRYWHSFPPLCPFIPTVYLKGHVRVQRPTATVPLVTSAALLCSRGRFCVSSLQGRDVEITAHTQQIPVHKSRVILSNLASLMLISRKQRLKVLTYQYE